MCVCWIIHKILTSYKYECVSLDFLFIHKKDTRKNTWKFHIITSSCKNDLSLRKFKEYNCMVFRRDTILRDFIKVYYLRQEVVLSFYLNKTWRLNRYCISMQFICFFLFITLFFNLEMSKSALKECIAG